MGRGSVALTRIGAAARSLARRRWSTALLAVILLLTLTAAWGLFYYQGLNTRVRRDEGYYFPASAAEAEQANPMPHSQLPDLEQVDPAKLEQALQTWSQGGGAVEDRNVLNILLCGVDTQTGDARGGRSDAVMLVSVNRRRHAVVLTSVLRDSCSYIDLQKDPNNPRCVLGCVASAYSLGGPATLMETLSADYRIPVNDYVCVDFSSFPKLIDSLGGVALNIGRADADYIDENAHGLKEPFPWGEGVHLTGDQALLYTRVSPRDEQRADRQRAVILAILESARAASPGQVVQALGSALRYVRTSLGEEEAGDLAKEALTQGWLGYKVTQLRSPVLPGEGGQPTALSADLDGRRVWIVDYAREAKRVQEAIYGHSEIEDGKDSDYIASLF